MTEITQVLTEYTTTPTHAMSADDFEIAFTTRLLEMVANITEQNILAGQINTVAGEVNTNKLSAETAKDSAETAAASAGNSASSASNSASAASTSESNAGNSASAAAGFASSASDSASAASTSENNAADSEAAAAASAAAAEQIVVGDFAVTVNALSAKSSPADADSVPLVDTEDSNSLKKLTWANLKAALTAELNVGVSIGKTYFLAHS